MGMQHPICTHGTLGPDLPSASTETVPAPNGPVPDRDVPAGEDQILETIVARAASETTSSDAPTTYLTFCRMVGRPVFVAEVPLPDVAAMLNGVGDAAVAAGLHDVQFRVGKHPGRDAGGLGDIYGVVVDVDRPTYDVLAEIEQAGVPMPTVYFMTAGGLKLVYAADRAIDLTTFDELAARITLAFDGGDPRSWAPTQGQRLPHVLKRTKTGIVEVNFRAYQASGEPFAADPGAVPFPRRVLRALGIDVLSSADRRRVRDYLDDIGIPAPGAPGHAVYARCPAQDEHSAKKCFVNVRADGSIFIVCLGDHDGAGRITWSERELLALAGGDDR